jgi:hypothetical protein
MSGKSRILGALVWLGLCGSVACAQGYPAQNGQVHYDPSKCSKDPHGMVYFAVGRRVFRQPMENIGYIAAGSRPANSPYPSPPDPSEPMGCPGRPLPGGSYTLSRMSAMPEEPRGAYTIYADHIAIIINDGSTGAFTRDGLFDLLNKTRGLAAHSTPGFVETGKGPDKFYYYSYKAQNYFTPDGRNLTIACHNDLSDKHIICEYGYMIGIDLAISATFLTDNVPLTEIFGADQEIRHRIEAAQVKDFRWVDPKAGN